MKMIFIVSCETRSHDNYWVSPVLATFDKAIADAKVKEMTARFVRRNEVWHEIRTKHMGEWDLANPVDRTNFNQQKENHLIWVNNRYSELTRFTATFTKQEQADLDSMDEKSSWSYEEIPFEE